MKNEPQNEILVQKQRELDSTLAKIAQYRKQINTLKLFFKTEAELLDGMVDAENEIKA